MQKLVLGSGLIRKRLAAETDPIRRRNIAIVLRHLDTEKTLDYNSTMATFTRDCYFRNYNYKAYPFEVYETIGYDNVRELYKRRRGAGIIVEYNIERLVVDTDVVVTEGNFRSPLPGTMLIEAGYKVDDPQARYFIQGQLLVIWPIAEDGLIRAEESYMPHGAFEGVENRKADPSEPWPLQEAP